MKDLTEASLDELMSTRVTSVSRQQVQLLKTASAVYVLTQEDIRRSGATDVADLLRMVPGVNVAQISSSKWAVSVRGFNGQWANKVLVLVDGRSVYAPSFSGVFWDLQDFVIDDIQSIEVIRGPGATMWGANAVNGVISITTKKAEDTKGGLLGVDSGSRKPGDGFFRFGGAIGSKAAYRVFAKQTVRTALPEASSGERNDGWNLTHGGFRLDWNVSGRDALTIDGDLARAQSGARVNGIVSLAPIAYRGHEYSGQRALSMRTRWKHAASDTSNFEFQFYYENINNYETFTTIEHLLDLDLQHSFQIGSRHKVIWGVGQRWALDRNINGAHMGYSPASSRSALSSAFLQDEIALSPDRLYLTLGTKAERNSYTGFELQPTARLLWMPDGKRSIWGAVSRAVRTANRSDRGFRTDVAAWVEEDSSISEFSLLGHPETRSETLIAYELGHRYQATHSLSMDFASFFNKYDHLQTVEPGEAFFESNPSPEHLVIPIYFSNKAKGETYGIEASAKYKVHPLWTLKGGYSLLRMDLHPYADSQDTGAQDLEGRSPRHQIYAGTSFSLPKGLELSANSYFVGALPASQVKSYTRLDLNLVWRAGENLTFRINGQNLLNPSRPEFGETEGTAASLMKRSVRAGFIWKF